MRERNAPPAPFYLRLLSNAVRMKRVSSLARLCDAVWVPNMTKRTTGTEKKPYQVLTGTQTDCFPGAQGPRLGAPTSLNEG